MTTKDTMSTGSRLRSAIPYLVCAAVVLGPLSFYPFFKGAFHYDNHRLIELACAVAVLGVVIVRLFEREEISIPVFEGTHLLLVLYFASGLLSSLFSSSPRHAFFEWANFLALLFLAWLIAEEIASRGVELLDRILLLCGVACAVYLIVEIASYIHVIKTGKQPSMRQLIVGYDNYRFFNHVQTVSLPMLGLLATRIQNFPRKMFWWTVCTLWWTLLFVGAGRGAMVGLAAGILLARMTLGPMATTWSRHMLFSAIGGGIGYLIGYVLVPLAMKMSPFGLFFLVGERTGENIASGREALWARAISMVLENPWLGTGPMHFAHYSSDLDLGAHPHNWLLQIASEWGLPALIFLLVAVGLAMRALWNMRTAMTASDQHTLSAWYALGWAILVDGLVSGLIVMPLSQLWITLYAGCALGWYQSLSPQSRMAYMNLGVGTRVMLGIATVVALISIVAGVAHELDTAQEQKTFVEGFKYRPRQFKNGFF